MRCCEDRSVLDVSIVISDCLDIMLGSPKTEGSNQGANYSPVNGPYYHLQRSSHAQLISPFRVGFERLDLEQRMQCLSSS